MDDKRWEKAHAEVEAVKFDPLEGSPLKYVEFEDGVQQAEAIVLNRWIDAFIKTHGHPPDGYALRVFTKQLDPEGPRHYARRGGRFLGNSPHDLPADQIEFGGKHKSWVRSPAYMIRRIYRHYLQREVDRKGLEYWLMEVAEGASVDDVLASIKASEEYRDLYPPQPGPINWSHE